MADINRVTAWGVVVDTCTHGLKRGASNSAETIYYTILFTVEYLNNAHKPSPVGLLLFRKRC